MKEKNEGKKWGLRGMICGTIALTLFIAGCGGGSSTTSTAVSLGAINKVGATAIPNTNATSKPMLSRNFIEEGIGLLFSHNIANAAHTECQNNASPIVEAIEGGEIEIDEAIVILAQVEADLAGDVANDPKAGPFALDLLDNNPDAGESVTMTVPEGNYEKLKTDFKRIDDDGASGIPPAIRNKLLDDATERRASVWIKGDVAVGGVCTPFTFVTDHRWKLTIPFVKAFTDAGNGIDLIVLFRLVDALKDAIAKTSGADATTLVAEVGAGTVDPMGAAFLDGRTKDPDHGTTLAEAWASEIPLNTDVFAQNKDAVTLDDSTDSGSSMVDDSANRISGDDNPSASDLAESVT